MNRITASFLLVSLFASSAAARPFATPPSDVPVPPPAPAPVYIEDTDDVVVSRDAVRAALVEKRAQSIRLFRDYWRGGIYPHNTYTTGALNVWLDEEGRLCAAATIIANSGFYSQVMEQAADNNFIRLKDVEDGWLMDWILTSGLTHEEIVMIQAPFVGGPGEGRIQPSPIIVQPAPEPEPDRWAAIDAKLRKKYVKIDRTLTKQTDASLERATDRLMANPELAEQLLRSIAAG